MRKRTGRVISVFLVAALLVSGLDLWSKKAVFDALDVVNIQTKDGRPRVVSQDEYVVIEDWFEFEANYNYGAFSGWFARHTSALAIVSALAIAVIAGIFVFHVKKAQVPEIAFALSLGLLLGGTLGNLYDRAVLAGVRDWIKWFVVIDGEEWVWPNFNIADAGICVGVTLLLIREFRIYLRERRARAEEKGSRDQGAEGQREETEDRRSGD